MLGYLSLLGILSLSSISLVRVYYYIIVIQLHLSIVSHPLEAGIFSLNFFPSINFNAASLEDKTVLYRIRKSHDLNCIRRSDVSRQSHEHFGFSGSAQRVG